MLGLSPYFQAARVVVLGRDELKHLDGLFEKRKID